MMGAALSLKRVFAILASLSLLTVLCAADAVGDLQTKGRSAVDAAIAKSTTCTKDKVRVRKEWYDCPFPNLHSALYNSHRNHSLNNIPDMIMRYMLLTQIPQG